MMFLKSKYSKIIAMIAAILVVVVIVYANIVSRKDKANKEEIETPTQVQKLLDKDYEKEYPASVREVVRTYFKAIECMYNEELSEDDFIDLADVERELLDDELLGKNPYGEFLERLRKEVNEYKNNNTIIAQWDVGENDTIKYWYHEKDRYASVIATIRLTGKQNSIFMEKFILRCDEEEKWRILGWEEAQNKDVNEDVNEDEDKESDNK